MGQKRRLAEYESDLPDQSRLNVSPQPATTSAEQSPFRFNLSKQTPHAHHDLANGNSRDGADDNHGWQVAESSKKKKKKKQKVEADSLPFLRFDPERQGAPVRIKDLQGLVLYTLADGVAPNWVAVKDAKSIKQALVLMVPGMDKAMLESAVAKLSAPDAERDGADGVDTPADSMTPTAEEIIAQMTRGALPSTRTTEPLADYIIRIKAPGDPKTGRMHSPLQTMLISPEDKKEKSNSHGRHAADVFQPVQTPLVTFIHSAEELCEADYPVHPAIFTNDVDAAMEKTRREETRQSHSGGWVDTPVTHSTPQPASKDTVDAVTQGLDVYALDCEMVMTDDDKYSLARISVVDWHGKVIMDELVLPDLPIKNYFTQFSGITEEKLKGVTTRLSDIQKSLSELFGPSVVLIGHSLESDFNALKMTHPFVIDTSMVYPHPRGLPLRSSLKFLTNKYLKREIQKGGANGHDSVEDARAVLDLVRLKCEKGPTYGTLDMNGESIFSRLDRSAKKTAIVEYGTPDRGFGRHASVKVGCKNDDEVADAIIEVMKPKSPATEGAAFTWGRFRDMEAIRGWNSSKHSSTSDKSGHRSTNSEAGTDATAHHERKVQAAEQQTVDRLVRVYEALDPSTLVIVYPGPGDMREVLRLQELQRQFKREFKVKKWDELSVRWTDDEEQALRKAFNEARAGWALVCVK
ncbi:uncharacterized protein HMPREF1541_08007 [Cyphellophora europaea CBS 101466]|uniref:Exonuclease domain-containing protein n=1 Tax=Cyphellophora europaea (strain CBS 101466) TaxID=1220924 RepID=W2RMR8_CYPE1|nr:uncharacterized protein HMPREF1541_08007 [Cyphellophora europaea CBS 101466]ETN37019.1 hypothetical protein HMPREF1541_08007 [Cyphellophora europaea CBS 101466]